MDLNAMFDTVDHDILLEVLSDRFGVNGKALHWFETYLRPRYCQVDVQGKRSSVKKLGFSVVQDSCLGLVLYNSYASTLEALVPNDLGLNGFAKNHSLNRGFDPNDPYEELTEKSDMKHCLDDISSWMSNNRLKMNSL